jgi:hypothetical protein
MSEIYGYEGDSPMNLSSEGGSPLNISSEEQHGGGLMSDIFMYGCIVYCCLTMIMSIIMILIINGGNHCKNRGGKK